LDVELIVSSHVLNEWSLLGFVADEVDTRTVCLNSADLLAMVIGQVETILLRVAIPCEYITKTKVGAVVIFSRIDSIDCT